MGQPNIIFYDIKCNTCNTIIRLKMSTQSQYVKKWHQSALQDVVKDLVREKEEGWKNRTARDSYTTKIKSLELIGISITPNALYKRVERESKKKPNEPTSTIEEVVLNDPSEVSSISCPSTLTNITDSETQDLQTSTISSSKAGRPKGSTMQKKREDISKYKQCLNAITEEYHKELISHKETRRRTIWKRSLSRRRRSLVLVIIFLQKR
jgi:hypothetical protein